MSTQETREEFRERIYTEYHTRRGEALLRESKQKGVSLEEATREGLAAVYAQALQDVADALGDIRCAHDEIRAFAAERGIELGEASDE